MLAPLRLTASGPVVWTTDVRGMRSSGDHRLDVVVPPGTQLVVTKAYEMGHVECRPAEGDFVPWIDTARRRPRGPAEPVAPAGGVPAGMDQAGGRGRMFERVR